MAKKPMTIMGNSAHEQAETEAAAFDARITERERAGYIPDIRRAVKCDYFYKSFWRDPHYVRLFLGQVVDRYLEVFAKYGQPGMHILDAGCGAGYISLELARAGYCVRGIDVSGSAIDAANRTLAENPFTEGFGSLEYDVQPVLEATGEYDAVLFSGVIHHFPDPERVVRQGSKLLSPDGLFVCMEPCHERWGQEDAAQVALIRGLLSITGHWQEPGLATHMKSSQDVAEYTRAIHREFVDERDEHETGGQSPHDNDCDGEAILAAVRRHFDELDLQATNAFIYRLLGGLRGPESEAHALADFITAYERQAVDAGWIHPNGFLFTGRPAGN